MARQRRNLRVVPVPEPDKTAEQLHHYDDTYLDCRGLAHTWASVGFFADAGHISRLARCTHCGTEKIVTMRQNGALVQSRYAHPEGYLFKEGGVSKADVRHEVIVRAAGQTYGSLADLRSSLEKGRKKA